MTYISDTLRRLVAERANGCCEYCLVPQDDRFFPHEPDHIIPEKHRGATTKENLCLSCMRCNRNKGSDFASFDPQSDTIVRLFNPRKDQWSDHFRLDGIHIEPKTEIGNNLCIKTECRGTLAGKIGAG